jgi:hypothetical protein
VAVQSLSLSRTGLPDFLPHPVKAFDSGAHSQSNGL